MALWYEIWHEVMFCTLIIIIYLLCAAFVSFRDDNTAVTEPDWPINESDLRFYCQCCFPTEKFYIH